MHIPDDGSPAIATIYQEYLEALRAGDRRRALGTARRGLEDGVDIRDLYLGVFQRSMYEIGQLWEANLLTVAQEHLATAITQSVMAQIYDLVVCRPPNGYTLVATCLGGELHELGIRMVADFFELEGWEVYYLGANMPAEEIIPVLESRQAHLLAISVTLGGHVSQARDLIAAVRAAPVGSRVKIMIGGLPFNRSPEIAQTIGADFTARDARAAVRAAAEVLA